jgi:triosephosphate isomerase (TIM)
MRKRIVAGNWKMNKDAQEAQWLASEVANMIRDEVSTEITAILAPPFVHLTHVQRLIKDIPHILLAAQNCHFADSGAYTGEISAPMLKSIGVSHVILGHSERREYFAESNELLKKKVDNVLLHGLTPIFCCGESLDMRQNGDYVAHVSAQLTESLFHLSADVIKSVVIAYEPIWAIGTGMTASSQQAQEMHAALRKHIANHYGTEVAEAISILYGGSCNPSNAKELFACADVDGGLIGGASLKSRDFTDILKSF